MGEAYLVAHIYIFCGSYFVGLFDAGGQSHKTALRSSSFYAWYLLLV